MPPSKSFVPTILLAIAFAGSASQSSMAGHMHHFARAGERFSVGGSAKVSFGKDVVPVLRRHCAECHTGSCGNGVAFFDAAGYPTHRAVERHAGQILLSLQTGRMPAGRPYAIPSDQFRLLDVWAASGAPDN